MFLAIIPQKKGAIPGTQPCPPGYEWVLLLDPYRERYSDTPVFRKIDPNDKTSLRLTEPWDRSFKFFEKGKFVDENLREDSAFDDMLQAKISLLYPIKANKHSSYGGLGKAFRQLALPTKMSETVFASRFYGSMMLFLHASSNETFSERGQALLAAFAEYKQVLVKWMGIIDTAVEFLEREYSITEEQVKTAAYKTDYYKNRFTTHRRTQMDDPRTPDFAYSLLIDLGFKPAPNQTQYRTLDEMRIDEKELKAYKTILLPRYREALAELKATFYGGDVITRLAIPELTEFSANLLPLNVVKEAAVQMSALAAVYKSLGEEHVIYRLIDHPSVVSAKSLPEKLANLVLLVKNLTT
jgi:hypothetical protein